jgi:hypothetical protein
MCLREIGSYGSLLRELGVAIAELVVIFATA